MQYRTLGRTGVQVSTLALGTMNFGALGRTTQAEATALVDAALEAGINTIDAVVTPGLDLAPDEKNDTPPSLLDASLRRR
ncbi:putative aldo/keto reductase-like oxidoreductase [Pseudonocardia parietis]|uniref:Aldo/keto reductase-like oxidoreductase n=1 Tax=Pseudonocardia parietis TaxID=570936 RepID=A0ABS4VSG9_9PSEU|nr:putative aldo/keto reductase-like oxidoreductase [Pseudonocardia parietis]